MPGRGHGVGWPSVPNVVPKHFVSLVGAGATAASPNGTGRATSSAASVVASISLICMPSISPRVRRHNDVVCREQS